MTPPPLVLASASPRRAALLSGLGLEFEVRPAHLPEEVEAGEGPEEHAERLAREKVARIEAECPDALVVGADTVVVLDGRILGKPADAGEAEAMLLEMAGRRHHVVSGVALAAPGVGLRSAVSRTAVEFRAFGPREATLYAATGEPLDKAGAYGIQGMGASLVRHIEGDYYTVVGLPVALFLTLLEEAGWRYAFDTVLEPV